MTTFTAKATASSKTSGTTLASSSTAFTVGSLLIAVLGYDDAQGHPTVKWGNRILANRPAPATRDPVDPDIGMSVWVLNQVKRSTSHVVTGTWISAIVERALALGEIDGKNRIDQATGNNDTVATADPTTGLTAALAADDDFAVAIFVAEGPDTNDTPGTMQIKDGGTWTNVTGTQRIGTNGAPPVSNVTVNVGWLQLTSAQATEARIQTATSRKWLSAIITFKESQELRQGVTATDIVSAEQIFEDHSPALDPEDAAYVYNPVEDRFEVFDLNDMATRIGFSTPTGWSAG